MLGQKLVTHQTGPQGKEVNRVYVEAGFDIDRELYLGMLVDRGASRVVVMASTEGGMEIENVARDTPEKIIKVTIDPATGLMPYHARRIAYGLGLEGDQVSPALKFIAAMYRAFVELDASIVEINPLVVTKSGEVMALDAKMNFDDNALFRHKEVEELRDESEEEPAELEAAKHGLNYIKLDGNIGCMVNGAGLAMATMDIIKLYGGAPGQFPRCRRRRHAGAGDHRLQADPLRSQCRRHPGQHLRRHHALRRHRRRRGGRGPRDQPAACRWWCASRAPMSSSARRSCGNPACRSCPPTIWPTPPRRSSKP